MDNDVAKRAAAAEVIRKSGYGYRNKDAARLAVRVWTVTTTAEMADLNVFTNHTACGRNGGKPWPGRTRNDSCLAADLHA